jgi:hypothetical protein
LRSILVIDAIVAARYSSPPCEYAEGGDFRATLSANIYENFILQTVHCGQFNDLFIFV